MPNLKIASAQFENASGDKSRNLRSIHDLAAEANQRGCSVVAFHECSITGYTFASRLSRGALLNIAEMVPDGPSTNRLIDISRENSIAILAGLFEKDETGNIYNTYICVDNTRGFVAKFRMLHPFISPHLSPGNEYIVFDLLGWKCGILICYDNNVVENVRATALLGAEIIFMPHVTMCTPSSRPGAGFVEPDLWHKRMQDPTTLRAEFNGLKGRAWLMKWLPARAHDNSAYIIFSNPIGMDDDQLKNGCSMILDPFGDILAECTLLDEDIAVAVCTKEKLEQAGGFRYRQARRPEIYRNIQGMDHLSSLNVSWMEG